MADETSPTVTETPTEIVPADGAGKINQEVNISDIGPCKKHVKITIPREVIDDCFKEKYREIVKDRSSPIPGFRPGKAPRKFIERRFKSAVTEEVRRELLMASLQQLAEDSKISPLAPPNLQSSILEIPETGPFSYEFDIEVAPDFELGNYKGMKLRRPVKTFTDADIKAELARILEPEGQLIPKPGDNPTIEMNDFIICDVLIHDGDRKLNELKEIRVRIDKRLALQDGVAESFGKELVGAKAGDKRTVHIKIADTISDETLRNKTVDADFDIKDVKIIRLPELTPDLLERKGVKNVAQLEELVATSLERNLEYTQRQFARQEILRTIADSTKWELPQDLLKSQATRTLTRRVLEMRSSGMTDEQIAGRMNLLQQNAVQSTAVALMEHFVLQKVAELEKIEIEDADIDNEIQRIADRSGESFRKVKARMERENQLESLATELLERKALDVVLNNAEYEDFELKTEDEEGEIGSLPSQAVPGTTVGVVNAPATEEEGAAAPQ